MSSEASESAREDESRASDIRRAREQVQAALRRQQQSASSCLSASGPRYNAPKLPSLPGYTVVRELHRGGQGVVYLAVQQSTERQVAIKVVHRHLRDGGSAGLARFQREIEILTRLKHPNIVTVHDCGRDEGNVYLVMDYVDGRPLDSWASRDGAPLARKLDVFAKICDGVNAAHLRGVIHRDLKPGNILVDERDQPHVLDFGLAKLVQEPDEDSLSRPRAMTMTGQFIGSLPWSSPEQAEGRSESLDLRTDVYSLGVMLYQLLTGQFPYPVSGRNSEVVRHIVESEPIRPSSVDREIDRELETIVLKCLAKEPERRYQSAGDLARDIRRYLAGEAIEARRDSLVYVMAKRIARYRMAAIAAAAILLIVFAALIVSIAFWREAEQQRVLAQESATRADLEASQARAVTEFMREVLTSVEPENDGADVRLIEVLQSASDEAPTRFAHHPNQEAQVRDLLGQVYGKLSMWTQAKAEFGQAEELWRRGAGPDDPRALEAASHRVQAMINLLQTAEAEAVLSDLVPRMERVLGGDDPRTLNAHRAVAITHLFRGRDDEAERLLLELRAHPRLADDDAAQARIINALIAVYSSRLIGDDAGQRQAVLQAEALALEWIERSTRLSGSDSAATLHARARWAELACELGRHRAAAEVCRDIIERTAARFSPCHDIRASAMITLAAALTGLGEHVEPAELNLQRLQCLRDQLAPNNVLFLANLTEAMRYVDRAGESFATEGESIARELLAGLGQHDNSHDIGSFMAESYLAHFISVQGRLEEAEPMFRAALVRSNDLPDAPRARAGLHLFHAGHLIRRGDYAQAEVELLKAAELVGDVRIGTWDSHPDDIILGFIALYQAWQKPEKALEYERMREELARLRASMSAAQ